MIFSLFEYLESVNCNHRYYVQLWQLFEKNAITFDQKEIQRKKKISRRHEILLRIQSSVFSQKVVTRHNCVLSKQPIKSLN